jgi:hypothetical protein
MTARTALTAGIAATATTAMPRPPPHLVEPLTENTAACTRSPVAMEPSTTQSNWAAVTCKRVK